MMEYLVMSNELHAGGELGGGVDRGERGGSGFGGVPAASCSKKPFDVYCRILHAYTIIYFNIGCLAKFVTPKYPAAYVSTI